MRADRLHGAPEDRRRPSGFERIRIDDPAVKNWLEEVDCHRDYQMVGSVFVTQYPRRLVVDSPGGFPHGITIENILDRQAPRNRRLAELLHRCGLVERAGQGMNLMFEMSVRQSKTLPDFKGTVPCGA